jgi:hypothetical protein
MENAKFKTILDAIELAGYEIEAINPSAIAGPVGMALAGGTTRAIDGTDLVVTDRVIIVAKKVTRTPVPSF